MIKCYFFWVNSKTQLTKKLIVGLCLSFFMVGCASVKQLAVEKDVARLLNQSELFSSQFTGFSLFDISSNQYIAGHNSTLKFTPASNTKLLTMYAVLRSFQDSIPSLIYEKRDTTMYISPLGDPTFLYAPFQNQPVFHWLKRSQNIRISWPEHDLQPYGSGWAWDDYVYDFQPQRSWWPSYGNSVNIQKTKDSLRISPPFFSEYVEVLDQSVSDKLVDRSWKFNLFKIYLNQDTSSFERTIPFDYSNDLLLALLEDTLKTNLAFTSVPLIKPDTIKSQHVDTVLQRMLKPSDNFLAEHLLLLAARQNGFDDIRPFIEQIKLTWLISLSDLVWVDGSGLSRYNLISPVDQVRLLKMCHDEYGWDRITSLLPAGGEGTLEGLYVPDDEEAPYLFAKTGTLSNNHNLSGYLVTRSGKRMIFSFMSNHFTRPTDEVKKAMEAFILQIREAY